MVVWASNLFITNTTPSDGSTTSSEYSVKLASKRRLADILKCYVCDEYYEKPRILPCGHTFCGECLVGLRESAVREFNKTRDRNAHRRGDCGYFTCPFPSCHYSMKIMNVSRWALKNKALSKAAAAAKRQEKERQVAQTQTTIDASSHVIAVPRTMFSRSPGPGLIDKEPTVPPPSPTTVMVQQLLQNSTCTESLAVKYCRPPEHETSGWKSYAFLVGMAVLDQFIKMT